MKAITFCRTWPAYQCPAFIDRSNIEAPRAGLRDLLVEVQAVSVNPADTKFRAGTFAKEPKILGWDAAGIVRQVGAEVILFKPGDAVYYAGSITRAGSYSEFQAVNERIVGYRPNSLYAAAAAAAAAAASLPLTSITAWELLFDRLGFTEGGGKGDVLLVVGAAGGVGSILVQLARQLTCMTVVGSALRMETIESVQRMGAHHVIDQRKPILTQLETSLASPILTSI
jgi:zinc-binding alcohol dehydrogenase family protein